MSNQYGPKTKAADDLHAMKYRGHGEDFRESQNRVAFALKDSDSHYHALREVLLNQRFMPAGRVQNAMGASGRKTTSYNCFVSGTIEDSYVDKNGIMDRAKEAAATMRMGGGIGYDFSTLRPRGFRIAKIDSQSSGPVSFMPIFDAVCQATSSYGHRRGAQMGMIRVDHPDIEEFIAAKQNDTALRGFNVSIAVTDAFMEAALSKTNNDFDLVWYGKTYKTINAQALWEKIMRSTWDWAEPGVFFIDTVNNMNNLYYAETIAASNPCFAADTLIPTVNGAFPIKDLVGKEVTIYDGHAWREIDNFRVTGENQRMLKIVMQDGSELRVTPAHTILLKSGIRKEARALNVDDELMLNDIEYNGAEIESGAYLKGFLLGDGSVKVDRATLWLYEPKWGCRDRLKRSAQEIEVSAIRTNAIAEIDFHPVREGVLTMTGLAQRKEQLVEWVTTCRDGLPLRAFRWDRASKAAFLAGFLDADGSGSDGMKGFGYQCTSINKKLLSDIQILLKSMGVRSKLGLLYGARLTPFGDEEYECRPCWRLSLGQTASVKLAEIVEFSRLPSFAGRELKYETKSRAGRVISIAEDGIDDLVYCCTVPGSHSVAIAVGIVTGQCGEQPLPPYGACLLGSFNLTKYLVQIGNTWSFNFEQLKTDIPHVVRAMDNVVDRSLYPLPPQRVEAISKRRMGLGVTGLANTVETLLGGPCYGDENFLAVTRQIMRTIRDESYRASVELAQEKGPFPYFDVDKYCDGRFVKTLPVDIQDSIRIYGIRNSHLTSVAPTGTISMTADNVSSGIEPVFAYKIARPVNTPDGTTMMEINDYGVEFLGTHGRLSQDVTAAEQVAVLVAAQEFVDSAVSKTCNVSPNMPWDDFKAIYEEIWRKGGKGATTFNSGGKRFALLKPVVNIKSSEEGELSCEIDENGRRSCE